METRTLDDFMNFTTRDMLISHPRTSALAWVETRRGVPNVLYMALETQILQQVTSYTADNGTELSDLRFDGAALSWVESPSANVNAASDTRASCERHLLWTWQWSSPDLPRRLVTDFAGAQPNSWACNPADGSFVYSVGRQIFSASNGAIVTTRAGQVTSLCWNPDGTALAFVSDRGDHSFVGIVRTGTTRIAWVSPSVDSDSMPTWSPQGSRLAFLRFAASVDRLGRGPQHGRIHGLPSTSLVVTDVTADGVFRPTQTRLAATGLRYASSDAGYGQRSLVWLQETHLFIGAEVNGWLHVLRVAADGSVAARTNRTDDITAGTSCEHASYVLAAGAEPPLLFTSNNCDDADGMGVWAFEAGAAGGPNGTLASVVVRGDGYTVAGMAETSGIAVVQSPARVAYLRCTSTGATQVFVGGSAVAGAADEIGAFSVRPRLVSFEAIDGAFTIHGQLFEPPPSAAPTPAVVFTHGGSQRQMFGAVHFSRTYALLFGLNQYLSQAGGVTVLSVNYRSGCGFGELFRSCNNCGENGAAEYRDILGGAYFLRNLTTVDGMRIGIHGLSYGGLNALQAVTRDSEVFSVAVANAPVFNWLTEDRSDGAINVDIDAPTSWPYRQLPRGPEPWLASPNWESAVKAKGALSWSSSPVSQLANLRSPCLIIHGDLDEDVDFQESVGIVQGARALCADGHTNVTVPELLIFPDESHGLAMYEHQVEAAQATFRFLCAHLGSPHLPVTY